MPFQPLPLSQRQAILEREIQKYLRRGFLVVSRSETSAQLKKPKRFSLFWAIVWFVLAVVPFVIYLLIYLARHDEQVYLSVDEFGRCRRS